VALPAAITSALYATAGVTSLTFQENVSATTQTINGISMVAHSIYACVNGGSDTAVAAALLENKSSGCAWNGSTTVNVVEPASGQTYSVSFDRPTPIGILVRVTTTNGNAQNITQAVLDYANGSINGLAGFVVAADVSPFEIAGAIMSEYPGYYVSKVEVSLESVVSYSTNAINIAVNEIATTQASFITVIIS
jgi:asparagine N-glycosylation enzyme membrane subunit Stt3